MLFRSAFYFLKTANLETNEAMAAFIPTINVMVGTIGEAQQTARAVAGMYNTMGKSMGKNLTITEKFTRIADILTYTYSTQDVQMKELVESYTKMAPYLSGMSDKFKDIITMLGFLNTHLLRSGRTGRLTGRAILQILKNLEKLSGALGIKFDTKKPMDFLKIVKQIRKLIEVLGAFVYEEDEVYYQEIAMYKVPTKAFLNNNWLGFAVFAGLFLSYL